MWYISHIYIADISPESRVCLTPRYDDWRFLLLCTHAVLSEIVSECGLVGALKKRLVEWIVGEAQALRERASTAYAAVSRISDSGATP